MEGKLKINGMEKEEPGRGWNPRRPGAHRLGGTLRRSGSKFFTIIFPAFLRPIPVEHHPPYTT